MNDDIKRLLESLFVRDTDGELIVKLDGRFESMEPATEVQAQRIVASYKLNIRNQAIKPKA